jgi:large subunit ribosomal protein L24
MAQAVNKRTKIRKGDQVIVITGRDKGKRGRVLEVKPAEGRIKVEGAGMIKRHQRANSANNRGGGIIEREALINISNVALLDPGTGKPTRVRYDVGSDGAKTRVAAGSGQVIEGKVK